jgi:hypothetical protein
MNSVGLHSAQVGPHTGEYAHTLTRGGELAQRPLVIQITRKEPATLFTCLTGRCTKPLALLFLHSFWTTTEPR